MAWGGSSLSHDLGGYAMDPLLERYTYADRDRYVVVRRVADNEVLIRLAPPTGVRFWYVQATFRPDGANNSE